MATLIGFNGTTIIEKALLADSPAKNASWSDSVIPLRCMRTSQPRLPQKYKWGELVSRLTDLIAKAKAIDPQLGVDMEREFRALSSRLSFGLNFERHRPEAVELPQCPVRRGDKVRVQPQRGSTDKGDQRIWAVKRVIKADGQKQAELELLDDPTEQDRVALENLVVIAEFGDTIYPGLVSTGRVSRSGDKSWHTVINGENYHALKALTWTHRGKVDAIYIDPPYNTGAKDWKYNNDYVEADDLYRHSKWLAMMERRLRVARELLNPDNSVLIVTIDHNECGRLNLLLEQTFPGARMQKVTSVINPRGKYRANDFARCEEYIFFLMFGEAVVQGEPDEAFSEGAQVAWRTFRRSDISSKRGSSKGGTAQFFPLYVTHEGTIDAIGAALPHGVPKNQTPARDGCTPVFPIRDDGTEMNWGLTIPAAKTLLARGFLRVGRHKPDRLQSWEISYLTAGRIADIEEGRAKITGRNRDGSVIASYVTHKVKMPVTTWNRASHNAETCGTELLKSLLSDKLFDFPKSLYAVEDALRLFVADKPDAVILDFFAGSGTTAHAVMRLNKQDGGLRQCISVTNNEVGAEEQRELRGRGLRPGDPDWEKLGICDYITKPRVEAAITGKTPDGEPIKGDYKFTDEFPMANGFKQNAEFFTLTYETPVAVNYQTAFNRIAPLLWLRAGSEGSRIDKLPKDGWAVADTYGLLVDLDAVTAFLKAVRKGEELRIAYIVTDDERRFQAIARRLPDEVEPIRLYESYLTNFAFTNGDSA